MIRIVFALALASVLSFAAQINWQPSYSQAVAVAKKDGKPIFLMISRTGCAACAKMQRETLADDTIVAFVNANFVPVEVDADVDSWNKSLKVFGTPTFYFLDKNEKELIRKYAGFATSEMMLKMLKEAKGAK